MKRTLIVASVMCLMVGCTSTITHYDKDGNITKVEEATNFSRAMDGTNDKSQMILIDGTYISFEASASAGENCTPGVTTKFANGKTAVLNAKDDCEFNGVSDTVKNFFTGVKVGAEGVTR